MFAPKRNASQRAFRRIVVDLDASVVTITSKGLPSTKRIADRFLPSPISARAFGASAPSKLSSHRVVAGSVLVNRAALVGRATANLLLDGIKARRFVGSFVGRLAECRRSLPDVAADVRPFGLAAPRCEHRNRRIVGVHDVRGKDMRAQRVGQWSQECADVSDPLCQQCAVQLDALARVDLRLPIPTTLVRCEACR